MKCIANVVWKILGGDGSILAAGGIRPSKDTYILLPSWCGKNKDCKISTKPRALLIHQASFDETVFLGHVMNIYSSKNVHIYIKDLLWRQKWVNEASSFCMLVG